MIFMIEEIPKARVAYMQRTGPYGPLNNALMEKLKAWAATKGLLNASAVVLGVALDDPAVTPPQNCRYEACVTIGEGFPPRPDAEAKQKILSGGRYAVFTVAHTAKALQEAWAEIFMCLLAAGEQVDPSRPAYERYRPAMVEKNLCEICVPV